MKSHYISTVGSKFLLLHWWIVITASLKINSTVRLISSSAFILLPQQKLDTSTKTTNRRLKAHLLADDALLETKSNDVFIRENLSQQVTNTYKQRYHTLAAEPILSKINNKALQAKALPTFLYRIKNAKKWATTGRSDKKRMLHFGLGTSSLLIGAEHFFKMLTTPHGGFSMATTQYTVALQGFFHTTTAFLGCTLLKRNKEEAARNAMIGPVPYQNLWLTCMSMSQWSRGSNAIIDMNSPPIITFSFVMLIISIWQTSKSYVSSKNTKGVWFKSQTVNAAVTFGTYTFLMIVWASLALATCVNEAVTPGYMIHFVNFIDAFPKYGFLLSNVFMNFAFVNNLSVFLATLLKYKVLDKQTIKIIYLLPAVFVFVGISICLKITNAGTASIIIMNSILSGRKPLY